MGYAILGEDPWFDWETLPGFEKRGIPEEAMRWVEGRLEALREEDPERWKQALSTGVRADNADRIGFLERGGFEHGGTFDEVNYRMGLGGGRRPYHEPHIPLPEGWKVRPFGGEKELSERAEAHRRIWQPWTDGNVEAEDYARLTRLPGYRQELDIVAAGPDGRIAAYVNGWIDPVNKIGDLGPVGCVEEYRRRGLTRAVICECLKRMEGDGDGAGVRLYPEDE